MYVLMITKLNLQNLNNAPNILGLKIVNSVYIPYYMTFTGALSLNTAHKCTVD